MGRRNKLMGMLTVFLALLLFIVMKPGDNPLLIMRIATISATVIFVGTFLYNHLLWRIPPFSNMHRIIDISGKWKGVLKDEEGVEHIFEMRVIQNFDDVKIKMSDDNFISESLICTFKQEHNGLFLYFMYKRRPKTKVTSKKDITFGSMIIQCDPDVLIGQFFTTGSEKSSIELYRD